MSIKLKPSYFKSGPLVISDSWIGSQFWMVRRSEVEGGAQSAEVHAAVLRPGKDDTRLMNDADILVLACFPADQSVIYKRSQVMLDLGHVGVAHLFVSDDGQITAIDEKYVQILDLYEVRSVAATVGSENSSSTEVVMCRSTLADVRGVGEGEEVRAIVMPLQLSNASARMLMLCASGQKVKP